MQQHAGVMQLQLLDIQTEHIHNVGIRLVAGLTDSRVFDMFTH